VFNPWSLGQNIFDLCRDVICPLKRRRRRKLYVDIEIPLVFIGEEAGRDFTSEPSGGHSETEEQN
jgi:hypothetical protein